jgi:hypothetical protein
VVTTTSFAHLARGAADHLALPDARIAVVQHPLGGVDEAGIIARADSAVEHTLALLTGRGNS